MADDKTKTRPQDASKVNVNQPYEVNWWCAEFKCTEQQLRDCVKSVGVLAKDVKACVEKKK